MVPKFKFQVLRPIILPIYSLSSNLFVQMRFSSGENHSVHFGFHQKHNFDYREDMRRVLDFLALVSRALRWHFSSEIMSRSPTRG